MNQKTIFAVKLAVICFFNFLIVTPVFCDVEIGIAAFNIDGSLPSVEGINEIRNFELDLGKNLATFNWYMGFDGDNSNDTIDKEFPLSDLIKVRDHDGYNTGIVPMLTWEPWNLEKINNGNLNDYIKGFASQMKEYNAPIRLRFGQEMFTPAGVDKWYDWQNQPVDYKNAFRKVHEIFDNNGATNVEFVWSPLSNPSDLTTLSAYYPGSDTVDWLGIDGYNRGIYGNAQGDATGQYFSDIFNNTYETFVKNPLVFGDKRIMIAEFAAIEETGLPKPWEYLDGTFTKAQWITDAFNKIKSMEGIVGLSEEDKAKIAAFYWFNIKKTEQIGTNNDGTPINQEFDWRLNSSPESWNAFKTAMQDPNSDFKGHVTPEPVSSALFLLGAGALGSRSLLRKRRKV